MPRAHHGGTPHTKAQQHAKTADDTAIAALAAGTDRPSIDAEPFDHGRWERAVATHIAGRIPAPTAGGTLSISEGAAHLATLAQDQTVESSIDAADKAVRDAVAALQHAQTTIEEHGGQAGTAAGGTEGDNLDGLAKAGGQAISDAMSAVAMFDPETVMGPVRAFYEAVRASAQKHGS